MKKSIANFPIKSAILLFTMGIAAALVSCSDDDGPSNTLTVAGEKSKLVNQIFYMDTSPSLNDEQEEIYRHRITLISSGLALNDQSGDIEGEGHAISLGIVSSTTNVESGTYTFTGSDSNSQAFDFWDGSIYWDYNTETETGEEYEITAGKVTVVKNGNTYTIDLEGTIEGVETIKAHYKGSATLITEK